MDANTGVTARARDRRGARTLLALSLGVVAGLLSPAAANAGTFLPAPGKVFTGLTGSQSVDLFARQVGKRPAVFGHFVTWGSGYEYAFDAAERARARLMLHISTAQNYGQPERITPLGIARGVGDGYLIGLTRRLAELERPAYVRLMSEMNQTNNAYSAFNRDGSPRGASHSTTAFRQAWRRAALILRGGAIATINAKLRVQRLPEVRGLDDGDTLPRPQIALVWVPQTRGSPDIPANLPEHYWPGASYVDWVGTDFYSRFPRFDWLEPFYQRYRSKPFMLGEWAVWGRDDPAFVKRLFAWMKRHPRLRMWLYNQGNNPTGPFRLNRHPRARRAIRAELRSTRWLGADELAPTSNRPLFGVQVTTTVLEGRVLVRRPGQRRPTALRGTDGIPVGSIVDVTAGRVQMTVARPGGITESVEVYGAVFKALQRVTVRPITDLVLLGGRYSQCPRGAQVSAASAPGAKRRERVVRGLWVKGKGRFRTRGKYGSASVRGTWWLTEDRCDGTRVEVREGAVAVLDFGLRRGVFVRAGNSYLARARR